METFIVDYPGVPFSITNEKFNKRDARDISIPFSLIEFIKTVSGLVDSSNITEFYNVYINRWNSYKNSKESDTDTLIVASYTEFIKDLTLNYSTEAEKKFLSKIDYTDPYDLDVALSFISKKIKEIALYYSKKRENIKLETYRKKLRVSNTGITTSLKESIIDLLTNNTNQKESINVDEIAQNLSIYVDELYDAEVQYFNRTPDISYYDAKDRDYEQDIYLKTNTELLSTIFKDLSPTLIELRETQSIVPNKKDMTQKYMGSDFYYISASPAYGTTQEVNITTKYDIVYNTQQITTLTPPVSVAPPVIVPPVIPPPAEPPVAPTPVPEEKKTTTPGGGGGGPEKKPEDKPQPIPQTDCCKQIKVTLLKPATKIASDRLAIPDDGSPIGGVAGQGFKIEAQAYSKTLDAAVNNAQTPADKESAILSRMLLWSSVVYPEQKDDCIPPDRFDAYIVYVNVEVPNQPCLNVDHYLTTGDYPGHTPKERWLYGDAATTQFRDTQFQKPAIAPPGLTHKGSIVYPLAVRVYCTKDKEKIGKSLNVGFQVMGINKDGKAMNDPTCYQVVDTGIILKGCCDKPGVTTTPTPTPTTPTTPSSTPTPSTSVTIYCPPCEPPPSIDPSKYPPQPDPSPGVPTPTTTPCKDCPPPYANKQGTQNTRSVANVVLPAKPTTSNSTPISNTSTTMPPESSFPV